MSTLASLLLASILPLAALSMTSFVKISTVLGIVRSGIGASDIPSATVVLAMSVALSALVMSPVVRVVGDRLEADPAFMRDLGADKTDDTARLGLVLSAAREPVRSFLKANSAPKERERFFAVAMNATASANTSPGALPSRSRPAEDDFSVLTPAFLTTELTEAFSLGVALLLPFLVIDFVVANLLVALGLSSLSSTQVSLPLKLLLFVSIDGWGLLGQSLISGYQPGLAAREKSMTQLLGRGEIIEGRYAVRRELGRGGMAAVYLCRDRVVGDECALKVLFVEGDPEGHQAQSHMVWFQQEARALAALDHPAIVRARDFGTLPDGAPFLVMDKLDGRSLFRWMQMGPLPWAVTWTLMDQVLSGLAHAHARRIIHGDLKPSNIMLDARGGVEPPRAFILDLGLAWLLADHIDPRLRVEAPDALALPIGGGTPGWLAPEQIRQATPHIGPATDLYALGCILWELLTGREVFEGTPEEILRHHRQTPVPMPKLMSGIPKKAGDFVVRLLAKRPWHRFRYAADAREAWSEIAPSGPILWKNPPRSASEPPPFDVPIPALKSPALKGPAGHLAPGILALRPCPLVGRENERRTLLDAIAELRAGREPLHRLILLEGDAGVGKSRLAEWVCEVVHEQGAMVPLRARYRPTPSPLDGLRGAILKHYNLEGQSREVIEQALMNEWEVSRSDDDGCTWVAATAAWLRPPAPDEPIEVGASGKRFVVDKPDFARAIVLYAFEKISAGRPIALWLDDIHLAPKATFESLSRLHVDGGTLRLFMVATVRAESVASDRLAASRIDKLCRVVPTQRIAVLPLAAVDTERMLRATLPLSDATVKTVIARTQGNPLFALQLVHAWASGGHIKLRDGAYEVDSSALRGRAVTTADLWDERLAALDKPFQLAAFAAAALGADIPLDPLLQLSSSMGLDGIAAVGALRRAQLLFSEQGHRLRWAHGLLHEHMIAKLSALPDAARIYRLAADALVFHPDAGTERVVRHRAQNLLIAGEAELAAEVVLGFVEVAWARSRDEAAIRAMLALLEGKLKGLLAARAARWTAEVERLAGQLGAARTLVEAALEGFSSLDDQEGMAHSLRLLAQLAADQGQAGAAADYAEQAYATFVSVGHDGGRAACEMVLGQCEATSGNHRAACHRFSNAAAALEHHLEPIDRAQCLRHWALSELALGKLGNARDLLMDARGEYNELGYLRGLAEVDAALSRVAHRAGDVPEALERARTARTRFVSLHSDAGVAECDRLLSSWASVGAVSSAN